MKLSLRLILLRIVMGCALLSGVAAAPSYAQEELLDGPKSVIISYRTNAAKRTDFREYMSGPFAAKLSAMRNEGKLAAYQVYYSWFPQPEVWDAMVVMHFPTYSAVQDWLAVERREPGGLDSAGLALASPKAVYSADLSWNESADDFDVGEVYNIIPYEYRDATEYRDYVAGYVTPQFDGWMSEGALSGYQIYMNRYPVGTPWDSLFIQRYRDFDAFGKRQHVLDKVRVGLRQKPEWMKWHSRKGDIRSETENSIAELIAQ